MRSILLAATPVHGHVTPVLGLARHLVGSGHRVRLLTGARYRAAVEATGAQFVPLPVAADYDDRDLDRAFPARARLRGIDRVRFDVEAIFLAPVLAQLDALDAAIAAEPVDAVVAESMFAGIAPLALRPRHERPAVISLGVIPLLLPSADTAPFGFGIPPMAGRRGLWRNRVLRALSDAVVFGRLRRLYLELLGATAAQAMASVDAVLQCTVPGFEYPRHDLPRSVHFIGPIRTVQPLTADRPGWWGDLAGERPVVHVTQGTVANRDFAELIRPTLDGLADEDVLVVVSTGGRPVADLGPLPANARAAEFLDYRALLPHVDAIVTNGGYGGVHEALRRGIPLVTSGRTEDKVEVGARVAWSGAGLTIRAARPSPRRIRNAVRRVLREDGFRRRSAGLGQSIANSAGAAGAEWIIDEACLARELLVSRSRVPAVSLSTRRAPAERG